MLKAKSVVKVRPMLKRKIPYRCKSGYTAGKIPWKKTVEGKELLSWIYPL
jgi:hypothetical protein